MKRILESVMEYHQAMRRIFLFAICSILSFQYIGILSNLPAVYWLHYIERPFVFRCLLPLLANGSWAGILVLISLFCSGLTLSMMYLYEKYWTPSLRNDISFITAYFLLVIFLTRFSNYYDFPSAFFFLILFILFENKKYLLSAPVFILACLNRETAIILIPVLFVMSRKVSLPMLFTVIFFTVRFMIVFADGNASGQSAYNNILSNFELYARDYLVTVALLLVGAEFVLLVIANTPYLPTNMLIYLGIVLPALLGVYVLFGVPTEVRVFSESMPILFLAALMQPKSKRMPRDDFRFASVFQGIRDRRNRSNSQHST